MFVPGDVAASGCRAGGREGHKPHASDRDDIRLIANAVDAPLGLPRSGSLYNVDGSPDSRVYIQMCGIEQVCIRSGL
jgi:hypothetical protein